jgi:thioredoxin 1
MNNVIQITDQTFADTINNNQLVVLTYISDQSSICKALAPSVDRVAREYIGRVIFGRINIEEFRYLAEHGIQATPTVVFIKNRQVIHKQVGAITENSFRNGVQLLVK